MSLHDIITFLFTLCSFYMYSYICLLLQNPPLDNMFMNISSVMYVPSSDYHPFFFPICTFKICSSTCFLQKPPPVIICSSIFIQFCLSPHRNMPLFHDTFMNIYSVMYVSSWVTRLVSLYIHILVISDAFLMSPHDFLSVPLNLLIIYVLPCPLPFSMPLGSCISFILHSC